MMTALHDWNKISCTTVQL